MKDEGLDIPPPQHQGRTNSFVENDGLEHKKKLPSIVEKCLTWGRGIEVIIIHSPYVLCTSET